MTDNLNRQIDFTNAIIVMTTNIGLEETKKRTLGFAADKKDEKKIYHDSLKKYLRPELLSRLDEILFFNKLQDKHLLRIVEQELSEIKRRLARKNIDFKLSTSVKKFILTEINKEGENARNIRNLVKVAVQVPLSKFIVKNRGIQEISAKIVDKTLTSA